MQEGARHLRNGPTERALRLFAPRNSCARRRTQWNVVREPPRGLEAVLLFYDCSRFLARISTRSAVIRKLSPATAAMIQTTFDTANTITSAPLDELDPKGLPSNGRCRWRREARIGVGTGIQACPPRRSKWTSLSSRTWSRHQRRIESMTRSATTPVLSRSAPLKLDNLAPFPWDILGR